MKKSTLLKIGALLCSMMMFLSVVGCARVEETEVWMSGEDEVETIVHSSGTQSTDSKTDKDKNESNKNDKNNTTSNKKPESNSGANKTDKNQASSVDSEGKTNVDKVNKETDFDLKGATVTVGYYLKGNGGEPEPGSATYQDEVKLISEIEEKYNCKIKFKTASGSIEYYNAWTAAAQAGVKFADIIQISTGTIYPTQMKAGYLTKLDNYIDTGSIIYNQNAMKQLKYNGATYATVMSNRLYTARGIFYNKKVLSMFGQNTPESYVKNNSWNFENFLKLAKATTGSKNGVDYYGYGYRGTDATFWAIANGGENVSNVGGKYKFGMQSDKYIKGIQFVYDLVNTDKVTPPDVKSASSLWKAGNVAMYLDLPGYGAEYMEALGSSNVGFTYIPMGPDVKEYNITVEETTSFAIPSTVKNPDVMASIMYDLTYPYKWRATLEEQHENDFGDAFSLQCAMDIAVRGNDNISLKPNYTYITSVANSGYGITDLTSPASYLASVAAAAQAELNEVWGQ